MVVHVHQGRGSAGFSREPGQIESKIPSDRWAYRPPKRFRIDVEEMIEAG
jgi:hypothetical protein